MARYRLEYSAARRPAAADRRLGMRHALVETLPGRAIVAGLAVRLAVLLLRSVGGGTGLVVGVLDTTASIAIAAGGGYFLLRGLAHVKRRVLWRVRRKLIISYIFIGFIPAILIAAFFLLGGLLLFSNFSSYLVQTRLRALADRAEAIASTTALEIQRADGRDVAGIVAQRESAAAREFRGASFAVVPLHRPCAAASPGAIAAGQDPPGSARIAIAGPWAHLEPPASLPPWVGCGGFKGLLVYGQPVDASGRTGGGTQLLVRAVAYPESASPAYAVVVDLLVNAEVRRAFREETGVELTSVSAVSAGAPVLIGPAGDGAGAGALAMSSLSLLEYTDWPTGSSEPAVAFMQLSIGEIYAKISAAQGAIGDRSFGQGLLLVLVVIGVLFLIIEALALLAGLALAKSITGSVHALFAGTERLRQGDFTHKIDIPARDQLGELAESFNSMTASIEDLLRQAAEKRRLEEELRIAREIQMSLLPQGPLVMPGLSMNAICVPAREVGGDYYDFFPLGGHRLGVLIADVSGKGTSAALYMAELKGLVLSLSEIHTSPRDLLISANRIIAANLDARSFITMTYAVIDLKARSMTYARAGHTPLMYLPGPSGGAPRSVRVLAPDGLVLGLKIDDGEMFERLLREETIPLREGDVYLFFTDGISEAMNAGDDCFGEQRLGRLIEEYADLPSDLLRDRVLGEIASFVGDAPQHDDMTMILLKIEDLGAVAALAEDEPAEVARRGA